MDINDNKGWKEWERLMPSEGEEAFKKLWDASDKYKSDFSPNYENAFAQFKQKAATTNSYPSGKVVKMPLFGLAIRIAAAILLVSGAIFLWNTYLSPDKLTAIQTESSSNSIQLPDGSDVTLNKASRLEFEEGFENGSRKVKLDGEGFFNVTKDPKNPFSIETAMAKITVLGTSFNVRSLQDGSLLEVYVESGKVKVEIDHSTTTMVLGPGELFTFNAKSNKAEHSFDKSGKPIAWKTGVIHFKGKPIQEVLKGIQDLFEVELQYKPNQFNANCLQTLTVEKGKMDEALQALERSCQNLHIEQQNDGEYLVTGTCCE